MTFDASRPTRMPVTRPRRRWLRVVALLLAAALLFALGVALGLALDDRPVPGGTQTFVRTLEPLPQREP